MKQDTRDEGRRIESQAVNRMMNGGVKGASQPLSPNRPKAEKPVPFKSDRGDFKMK